MYENGDGIAKDLAEALNWHRKAAAQGMDKAQVQLGLMYWFGNGVAQDNAEAAKWFRLAAVKGNADGQVNLGNLLSKGEGIPKDEAEAAKWYRKAANQQNVRGQFGLGLAYISGNGVLKDEAQGYMWMLLAAAQGNQAAKEYYTKYVEPRLTPEQRAEGQRLAREWKPSRPVGQDEPMTHIAESRPAATGSGFFVSDDGYLVTNHHVVENGGRFRIVTKSGTLPAKLIRSDEATDLAVLKVSGAFSALPVESSRWTRLGDEAFTVGFPNIGLQGFSPKLAEGSISSLSGARDDVRSFQISNPIQPGNSGGALLDGRGNVIGVVNAKLSQDVAIKTTGTLVENVNYAIKSSFLLGFLEAIPELASKLKRPNSAPIGKPEVIVKAEQAAVLVLVY